MEIIKLEEIQDLIIHLRDENVLIDRDVAELYGVTTKEINQAVSNNSDKFPDGYVIELTKEEKNEVVKFFDRLEKLKFSPYLPKAFTEKGLYMLATIIKSKVATQTTIDIIETFAKIKMLSRTISKLPEASSEKEQKSLMKRSGEIIAEILDDSLSSDEAETTIELNLAILKVKHTIKKKKND